MRVLSGIIYVAILCMLACVVGILAYVVVPYSDALFETSAVFNLFVIETWFIVMTLYAVETIDKWERYSIVCTTLDFFISFMAGILWLGALQHYEIVFMTGQIY